MAETLTAPLLSGTRWADWRAEPIAADASTRRYARLFGPDGQTAILLESDPATDTSLPTFLRLASHLRAHGLAAPEVLAADEARGTALLSDLGSTDLTHIGDDLPRASEAVAAVLAHLETVPAAPELTTLDPDTGGEMVRIAGTHYAGLARTDALAAVTTLHMQRHLAAPSVMALRDVHAENLIWRPRETGLQRIGLLDFQDAFVAPPGYDLASFLRDVRRDVDPDIARATIATFCRLTGHDAEDMALQLAVLAAQRNLRILGVFARLIRDHGKTKYRDFMPRTWRLLMEDLSHPALSEWKAVVTDQLPEPTQTSLGRPAP